MAQYGNVNRVIHFLIFRTFDLRCQCEYHFLKCVDILREYHKSINVKSIFFDLEFQHFICGLNNRKSIHKYNSRNNSFEKSLAGAFGEDSVKYMIDFCDMVKKDEFDNFVSLIQVIKSNKDKSTLSLDVPTVEEMKENGWDYSDFFKLLTEKPQEYMYFNFSGLISGILSADGEEKLKELFKQCYFEKILESFKDNLVGFQLSEKFNNLCFNLDNHIFYGTKDLSLKIGFSFSERKIVCYDPEIESKNDILFIGDVFKEKDGIDYNLERTLKEYFFDKKREFQFLETLTEKIKIMLEDVITNLISIDWEGYDIFNIFRGYVPIFVFTDKQIKNFLTRNKENLNIDIVREFRQFVSQDQFDRFIKILSEI